MSNPDSNVVFVDVKHYAAFGADVDVTAATESVCRAPARGFRPKATGTLTVVMSNGTERAIPVVSEQLELLQFVTVKAASVAGVVGW